MSAAAATATSTASTATAPTSAPPAPSPAPPATATPSTASFSSRLGFIDVQHPSLQLLAVHTSNCRLGFSLSGHLNKSESPRFSTKFIFNNCCRRDLSEDFKSLLQVL